MLVVLLVGLLVDLLFALLLDFGVDFAVDFVPVDLVAVLGAGFLLVLVLGLAAAFDLALFLVVLVLAVLVDALPVVLTGVHFVTVFLFFPFPVVTLRHFSVLAALRVARVVASAFSALAVLRVARLVATGFSPRDALLLLASMVSMSSPSAPPSDIRRAPVKRLVQ